MRVTNSLQVIATSTVVVLAGLVALAAMSVDSTIRATCSIDEARSLRTSVETLEALAIALLVLVAVIALYLRRDMAARARIASETLSANRFLDAIIDNLPAMVFVKEAKDLRFVRFNHAGEALLGMKSADLMGKNDFDFFPKPQAEFFVAKDRETIESGKLIDIPEEEIQTANGPRWLHTRKVPVSSSGGAADYLLGISIDITDAKQARDALLAAKEAAESAGRELESFSYSVSHDLRAPLRSISGFTDALAEDDGPRLSENGRSHLARIRAATKRMGELIDDLLKLSRINRAEFHRENVDVTALAREVNAVHEALWPGRKATVTISEGLRASADPALLRIALDNLIGNAWKFCSKTESAEIVVGAEIDERGRYFFVRDNGAGFDMKFAGKLFGAFQRLHSAAEFEGTGIGLATVQRVIHRHGGRIWAESEPGRGTTFRFTLEARRAEATA